MEIAFKKLSDEQHGVRIKRADGSDDSTILNSRSFLRHDLAHLAVESEVPLPNGYWGTVAKGASLSGLDIRGPDIMLAESLAGPVQTLMRTAASEEEFYSTLARIRPELASLELAARIREAGRRFEGHWSGTAYGAEMLLEWDESLSEKNLALPD
ncbi:MAG: hypothetical protein DHS20C12_25420 [Pseudohongiella sp.]|nr:MAG: hypothetical protein DHS20C12_25420 [Pseudohongiella sp.]